MNMVLQEWVYQDSHLSLKQQTVLLLALRGCDNQSKYDLSKKLTKMIRSIILKNAAADDTTFMLNSMTHEEIRDLAEDFDKYPIHFMMHTIHCCEIIGYKHSNKDIRDWFLETYLIFVDALHLKPESKEQCDFRLRDGVNTPYTEMKKEFTTNSY